MQSGVRESRYTNLKVMREINRRWVGLNKGKKKENLIDTKPWKNPIFSDWLENDESAKKQTSKQTKKIEREASLIFFF